MPPSKRVEVEVEGRSLSLSNLQKVYYPAVGFTKGQMIEYYMRIAPVLLPHLRDRPLTLKRYPNGVEGSFFYEKQCPKHRPDWVRTELVTTRGGGRWGRERDGGDSGPRDIEFCVVDDLATLVWTSNLADLELHQMATLRQAGFPLPAGSPAPAPTSTIPNRAHWQPGGYDDVGRGR